MYLIHRALFPLFRGLAVLAVAACSSIGSNAPQSTSTSSGTSPATQSAAAGTAGSLPPAAAAAGSLPPAAAAAPVPLPALALTPAAFLTMPLSHDTPVTIDERNGQPPRTFDHYQKHRWYGWLPKDQNAVIYNACRKWSSAQQPPVCVDWAQGSTTAPGNVETFLWAPAAPQRFEFWEGADSALRGYFEIWTWNDAAPNLLGVKHAENDATSFLDVVGEQGYGVMTASPSVHSTVVGGNLNLVPAGVYGLTTNVVNVYANDAAGAAPLSQTPYTDCTASYFFAPGDFTFHQLNAWPLLTAKAGDDFADASDANHQRAQTADQYFTAAPDHQNVAMVSAWIHRGFHGCTVGVTDCSKAGLAAGVRTDPKSPWQTCTVYEDHMFGMDASGRPLGEVGFLFGFTPKGGGDTLGVPKRPDGSYWDYLQPAYYKFAVDVYQ